MHWVTDASGHKQLMDGCGRICGIAPPYFSRYNIVLSGEDYAEALSRWDNPTDASKAIQSAPFLDLRDQWRIDDERKAESRESAAIAANPQYGGAV